MACEFQVFLNAGQHAGGEEAAVAALDVVDRLEAQLSVYRDDSEVTRLNRTAHDEAVEIEPRLFALLAQAMDIYTQTGGAFDITAAPLTKAWGFYRRLGRFPAQEEIDAAIAHVGSDALAFDQARGAVRFSKPGLEINLGAIGKGYALDRAAEILCERGAADFVIHGGLSSVLARGARAGRDHWSVAVRHPLRPEQRLAEMRLRDRSLGTSGSANQFFHHQGRRFGHVLDPRTGWPAEGALSATVLAPTAAEADALATALFVLGLEETEAFCQRREDVGALIITPGRRAGGIELHPFNLHDDDWRQV